MIVSIAIAKTNEVEAHRKKKGDIIAVRPEGWQWGRKEIENYDIIEINVPFFSIPDARKLEVPFFEDGSLWHHNNNEHVPIIAKRRYKLQGGRVFDKALKRILLPEDFSQISKTHLRNIKRKA